MKEPDPVQFWPLNLLWFTGASTLLEIKRDLAVRDGRAPSADGATPLLKAGWRVWGRSRSVSDLRRRWSDCWWVEHRELRLRRGSSANPARLRRQAQEGRAARAGGAVGAPCFDVPFPPGDAIDRDLHRQREEAGLLQPPGGRAAEAHDLANLRPGEKPVFPGFTERISRGHGALSASAGLVRAPRRPDP